MSNETTELDAIVERFRKAEQAAQEAYDVYTHRVREADQVLVDAHDQGVNVTRLAEALGLTRGRLYQRMKRDGL